MRTGPSVRLMLAAAGRALDRGAVAGVVSGYTQATHCGNHMVRL